MDAIRGAATILVLEVLEGPHAGSKFTFDRHDTFVVGRAKSTHLGLPDDPYFSRHHFMLEFNPPQCFLRDLESRNGTLVNGVKVHEAFLKDGDTIGGGRTRIRFGVDATARPDGLFTAACLSCGAPAAPGTATPHVDPAATCSYVCCTCREEIQNQPQPVPGFELVKKLGKGGMGVVYLARHLATGNPVAVKMIVPEAVTSERASQFFLREVSVLSKLDHPRVVRFHEVGFGRGQFFFVMDYVPTVDLRGLLLKMSRPKAIQLAVGLMSQILDGLGYAHENSIVHRDIKPSNVLVSRTGKKLRAKLGDFGLAKNFENAGFSGMTRQGSACGSLPYMAPEQIIDCRAAKPAADIYSAGATLYSLLSSEAPHQFPAGRDPFAVVLEDEVVSLEKRTAGLPVGLADIVHRALAKEPKDRYGTAQEFRRAILPYAKGPVETS